MHPRTPSKIVNYNVRTITRVMKPLGFFAVNNQSKNALCLVSDSGTSAEEGLFYKVPCVSVRQTTERYETVEAGAHIIAGIDPVNICESVELILSQEWKARYDFHEDINTANVVMNALSSNITNYF